jgi:hypothetical protein
MLASGRFCGLICGGAVALAQLLAPASALGQGEIRGTLVDDMGFALPGVTVTANLPGEPTELNKGRYGSRMTVTDATGNYVLSYLQSGTYTITFALQGFRIPPCEGVVVANDTVRVDAIAKVGCPNAQPGEVCVDNGMSHLPQQWSDVPCDTIALSERGDWCFGQGPIIRLNSPAADEPRYASRVLHGESPLTMPRYFWESTRDSVR